MPTRFYNLLICPVCGEAKGPLLRESNFLRCTTCEASYPTGEGFVDFVFEDDPRSRSRVQKMMEFVPLVRVYEKFWRPAATFLLGGTSWEIKQVTQFLAPLKDAILLDMACGPGNFTRPLARSVGKNGMAIGADLSRPMLLKAVEEARKEKLENIHFVRSDTRMRLPFVGSVFDGINCTGAMHLFPDIRAVCGAVRDLLKPGGRFVGTTYIPEKLPLKLWIRTVQSVVTGIRLFKPGELEDILRETGFDPVESTIKGMTMAWRAVRKK